MPPEAENNVEKPTVKPTKPGGSAANGESDLANPGNSKIATAGQSGQAGAIEATPAPIAALSATVPAMEISTPVNKPAAKTIDGTAGSKTYDSGGAQPNGGAQANGGAQYAGDGGKKDPPKKEAEQPQRGLLREASNYTLPKDAPLEKDPKKNENRDDQKRDRDHRRENRDDDEKSRRDHRKDDNDRKRDRDNKPDRDQRSERDKPDRDRKPERDHKPDKPDKDLKPDKDQKPERDRKPERDDKPERERPERERPERERPERDRPDRDRPEREKPEPRIRVYREDFEGAGRSTRRDLDRDRDRDERRERNSDREKRPSDSEFTLSRLQDILRQAEDRMVKPGDNRIFGNLNLNEANRERDRERERFQQQPLPKDQLNDRNERIEPKVKPIDYRNQEEQTRTLLERMRQATEATFISAQPNKTTTVAIGRQEEPIMRSADPIRKPQFTPPVELANQLNPVRPEPVAPPNKIEHTELVTPKPQMDARPIDKNAPEPTNAQRKVVEETDGDDEEKKRRQLKNKLQTEQSEDRPWEEPERKPVKLDPYMLQGEVLQIEQTSEEDVQPELVEAEEEEADRNARTNQFLNSTASGTVPANQQNSNSNSATGGGGGSSGNEPSTDPVDPDDILPAFQIFGVKANADPKGVLDQMIARMEDRKQHFIMEGDTLETIATQYFADARVADLIYRLNAARIPTKIISSTRLRVKLIPRINLYLPTEVEVKRFTELANKSKAEPRTFEYEKTTVPLLPTIPAK